jgi:hypothetical protein
MRANGFLFLISALTELALIDLPAIEPPPQTPKKRLTDEYHGVTVQDPYQGWKTTTTQT